MESSTEFRLYGLGIDQLVDVTVVLANGTVVAADACLNPELFWALRGGGGGTFGVVVHAHYKIYEAVPIVKLEYLSAIDPARYDDYGSEYEGILEQWLEFWIRKSPTLDPRWCGGFFNVEYLHILFCGSLEDAKTTFYDDFVDWYYTQLPLDKMVQGVWGSIPPSYTLYDSWYEYKGGKSAYRNACEFQASRSMIQV